MHKISAGALPQTPLEELTTLPQLYSRGLLLKGGGKRGDGRGRGGKRGKKRREKGGKGRGKAPRYFGLETPMQRRR